MATWVIGDVQGCWTTLQRLLVRIRFVMGGDRLWLAGDLVNRGHGSLAVLRWAKAHDARVTAVLGNHDLHLLARAAEVTYARGRDTLAEVLAAPDRDDLIAWLRERPLLHRESGVTMVHAGLLPEWTVDEALALARDAEAHIREPAFLPALFAVEAPDRWDPARTGMERHALTVTALTRVRAVTADGRLCAKFTGHPNNAPPECIPWFAHPHRRSRGERIVFGHWAALGLHLQDDAIALDTGCVWGGSLTAYRLEDGAIEQEPSAER